MTPHNSTSKHKQPRKQQLTLWQLAADVTRKWIERNLAHDEEHDSRNSQCSHQLATSSGASTTMREDTNLASIGDTQSLGEEPVEQKRVDDRRARVT